MALPQGGLRRADQDSLKGLTDLTLRERSLLYPLIALVILFGVYPAALLDPMAASVNALVDNLSVAQEAAQAAAPAAQPATH